MLFLGIRENNEEAREDDQSTVTVVHLKAGRDGKDGLPPSWWQKRKERIFRKKTLMMKVPILHWLPRYTVQDFVADLVAGITVGVTVIPQGLAYSTVAGLPPQVNKRNQMFLYYEPIILFVLFIKYGLYAAYVGCFVYAVFGSTHAVTIGPTALMALVTYDSGASLMGPEAAIILAFLTGCIVLLFGLLNFGSYLISFEFSEQLNPLNLFESKR